MAKKQTKKIFLLTCTLTRSHSLNTFNMAVSANIDGKHTIRNYPLEGDDWSALYIMLLGHSSKSDELIQMCGSDIKEWLSNE